MPWLRRPHAPSPRTLRPRPRKLRPLREIVGFAAAITTFVVTTLVLASPASAQVLLEDDAPVETYPVGGLELEYAETHPDHPSLDGILPIEVELRKTDAGWAEPVEGEATETLTIGGPGGEPLPLEATGVVQVLVAVVNALHDEGFYGVDVRPSPRDFDLDSEQDLRDPNRSALALEVRIGRIGQIRTIAAGSRIKTDWKIDNEIHQRIREGSPLQPAGVGEEEATDLLDRRALEDYLHRLNRHSGRRVEAALSPGEEPGEVTLDYRVLETKPWFAYAQVTNTGTERTDDWQTRFGYTHRQVSDRDDILAVEYLNSGGDAVNAFTVRYQAPFFGSKRPDWMAHRRGDPEWLDLIPLEDIPWWGADRVRWEVEFSWNQSRAGDAATGLNLANDEIVSEEVLYGGRIGVEAYQYRNFFLEVWSGLRFRHLRVENKIQTGEGDAVLIVPRIGIHGDQKSQLSNLTFDFSVDGQVNKIPVSNRVALGRAATDDRYALLHYNFGYSTYLEPILNPKAWADPSTHTSSTLAHEFSVGFRGQYALGHARLIPQANGAIGGLYSVRGYSQSAGVGDTTVIGSFEYRFHIPRAFPVQREAWNIPLIGDFRVAPQQVYGRPDWDLTLRAYVDVGRSRRNNKSAAASVGSVERNRTLVGAGIGAELTFRSNLRARIDWGTALKNESAGNSGAEVGDSEIHALFSIVY